MKCSDIEIIISESLFRMLNDKENNLIKNHIYKCDNCLEFFNTVKEIVLSKENVEIVSDLVSDETFNSKIINVIKSDKHLENSI